MNFDTIESGITLFMFGLLLGSTISIFAVKYLVNKRLKRYFNLFNEISLHKIKLKREKEQKINELKKIVKILNVPEKGSEPINYKTFKTYLNDLNSLLNDKGISQVDDSFPPD